MLKKIKDKIFKKFFKDQISKIQMEDAIKADQNTQKIREYYLKQIEEIQNSVDPALSWMVDPNYVFAIGKAGQILLNGDQITTAELKNLKSEIRAFKEFHIYKIIQSTLRQKAIEKAILASTDLYSLKGNEQVLAGKMMVFSLDVIKTIVEDIDKARLVAK